MLKINMPQEITADMKEARKDYVDRHTPHVIAPAKVKKGEAFDVTVKLGEEYVHPDIDDHYIVANIKMRQLSITTRLNLMITPEMSLQFYGMPFIATGDYSKFREVTSPRAKEYADRFASYDYPDDIDFNFKQFRSNLVFRWEYSPGSTIYLVWSRGATDYEEEYGRFSPARDFGRLFDTRGDNTFMIKINKWFSL